MLDLSETANKIVRKLNAGNLEEIGIDEVRDAIADEIFPAELRRDQAVLLEAMTLRKLFYSKL